MHFWSFFHSFFPSNFRKTYWSQFDAVARRYLLHPAMSTLTVTFRGIINIPKSRFGPPPISNCFLSPLNHPSFHFLFLFFISLNPPTPLILHFFLSVPVICMQTHKQYAAHFHRKAPHIPADRRHSGTRGKLIGRTSWL